MPVPGPGGERAREIQNVGTYIEQHISGDQGTQEASDYEAFAAKHSRLSAGSAFLGWMFTKIGPATATSLGLSLGSAKKAADQIAAGTVAGLDKVGNNKILMALAEIEKTVLSPITALSSVSQFLSILTEPHLWMRVVEGVIAIGLLLIAGNALIKNYTGVSPAKQVGKAAKIAAVA